jgi:hypothetical protein
MNVQPIQAIEEVNMFKSDGNVIHFSAPKGGFNSNMLRMAALKDRAQFASKFVVSSLPLLTTRVISPIAE